MHLSSISIKNFKGVLEGTFEPGRFGCLVGENNSGKSTVLQAIVTGLNRSGTIAKELYYDTAAPIEFHMQFSHVTDDHLGRLAEEHRTKIAEIIEDGVLELIVRFSVGEKAEVLTFRKIPIDERFQQDAIQEILKGKRPPQVANVVREALPELADGIPDDANITVAKSHIAAAILNLPDDQFVREPAPLPTGIPSSIGNLIPEPIYIPAVKNLSDELKTTQSTTFGRLLGLLLEEMEPALDQVRQSLATLDAMLNRTIDASGDVIDQRHDKVVALEQMIEGYLQSNFPQVALELNVPPPELKTILNSAEVIIDDGSRDSVDNKGDGLKRLLTFALLQTYVQQRDDLKAMVADNENEPARRPLIFLFEEPELYLHPKSQRTLFRTLAQIAQSHQVVLTTHSPIFFAPGVTAKFVRIAKEDHDPKPVAKLFPVSFDLDEEKAEVFQLARFENADAAFFSRRVILFEGESDDAFCRHVAQKLSPDWNFDDHSISLVRVSGKGNFSKFRRFYEAFGLDVKIVADLDAAFEGYDHLGAPAELNELRNEAIQNIDAFIKANGIKAELSRTQIKNKVNTDSWKQRYGRAREFLREFQQNGELTGDMIDGFERLFTWEEDIGRVKACREHPEARAHLIPLLDNLREHGICILAAGAIEAYYPDDVLEGPKPQRALQAIRLIENSDIAKSLSATLGEGRATELEEVFEQLFS